MIGSAFPVPTTNLRRIAGWIAALIPMAAAIPAPQGVAYVCEYPRNELARYDLASGARQTVTQGLGPSDQIVVRGRTAWVIEDLGELSTVDLDTGEITTVATGLGYPFGLALPATSGNQRPPIAYVAEGHLPNGGRLLSVDTGNGVATTIASGLSYSSDRTQIAVNPMGSVVYAAAGEGIVAIDVATGAWSTVPGTSSHYVRSLAITPGGDALVYSWDHGLERVDLTSAGAPPETLSNDPGLLDQALYLAFSPDGSRLAAVLALSPTIVVVEISAPEVPIAHAPSSGMHQPVAFRDADTLIWSDFTGALIAMEIATGDMQVLDAGLHVASELEIVGSTAYVTDRLLNGGSSNQPLKSVDLASGHVTTLLADGPASQWGLGLHASLDGTRLYYLTVVSREYLRQRWALIELELPTGPMRSVAELAYPSEPSGLAIDGAAGVAYLSFDQPLYSGVLKIDLASGVPLSEHRTATAESWLRDYSQLRSMGFDPARGCLVGHVNVPRLGKSGLGVVELGSGTATLADLVTFDPPGPSLGGGSRLTPDGRSVYSVGSQSVSGSSVRQILETDMVSPSHPHTVLLTVGGQDPTAFQLRNTADGPNVVATPIDAETGAAPVTLTFDDVAASGDTTLTTSTSGPAIPAGFQLGGAGVYYEIGSTAEFRGNVEICIDYTGTSFTDESTLQLLHYEHGQWVNVTTTRDPAINEICGVVRSFSPFAVVEWPAMSALNDLLNRVHNLDVRHGIVVSLDAKLSAVQEALGHSLQGNRSSAVNSLRAFQQAVRAQRERALPASVADALIADGEAIIALLGG